MKTEKIRPSKLKKFLKEKSKPLMGNNRSFSNRASKRKFATNRQKFLIEGEKYYIPVKLFRGYWAKLKKTL